MSTVTIVMATYNGVQYIERQLTSIYEQDRQPDEVLIFDDRSTDNTVSVVKAFIEENKCENWKIIVNEENVGWRRNFYNGLLQANGDFIFLCDQDDEWYKEKISGMSYALEQNPQIEVLASNATIKYDDSSQKPVKLMRFGTPNRLVQKVKLCGKTFRPIRPGCTYAIRKDILSEFKRLWSEDCAHDSVLWELGLLRGTTYILNKPYIKYYRHADNNTPSVPRGSRKARIKAIKFRADRARAYLDNVNYINSQDRKWLSDYITVVNKRVRFMETGNLWIIVSLLFKMNYYPKFASWCGDIYAYMCSKNEQ